MTTTTETDWVTPIGQPAFESIEEMVAAATLDWDRLEELRDERDSYIQPDGYAPSTWAEDENTAVEDVEELTSLELEAGDCESEDDAQQRIEEDPLSVEVGGWWFAGGDPEPTEYRILLATGGPAVRIAGDLGQHGEAHSARLEVQDWWKPWTEYPCDQDVLLEYVGRLYLGE
jgi:hypothetical protein